MIYAIIAALVLIADQWLKYYVTTTIVLDTGSQPLIDGVVKLVNIHNSGASFGLLDNVPFARWILLGLAAVLCVTVIVLIAKRTFPSKFATWCMVLFMAGALGNCIDRSIYGYVVDMFKLEFVSFAVFNIADAVLVVSCLLFIIYLFVGGKDEDTEALAAENKDSDKKSRRSKKLEEEQLPENEDDVWNNFKAALHPDDAKEEPAEEEVPLKKKDRRSALSSTAKEKPAPVVKEEPMPEASAEPAAEPDVEKTEAVEAVQPELNDDVISSVLPELNDVKPEAEAAEMPKADEFSLEEILREFGI